MNRRSTQGLNTGQDGIDIRIPNNKYCKHNPEKEDHVPEISY